ncbi:hypothetical protein [Hymenobacter sp. AT01-02]|uniref:hypothetical protein n=1 Tax=Hymenobacter sp. AT01-02 TaxID=1571877 RepID=UPI0005F272D4|nr:hypothetical protein [Hymenobacter sp. AT01-02]
MLRLHAHQHTETDVVFQVEPREVAKLLLSSQHQHCHVEQFYNVAFQPGAEVTVSTPVRVLVYASYRVRATVARTAHLLDGASLRGPPYNA